MSGSSGEGETGQRRLTRRATLCALGAGALAGLAGCSGGGEADTDDDSDSATEAGTDTATDAGTDTPDDGAEGVEPGTEQWVFDPDGVDAFRSSPTVVDGTVYIGRQTGHVFALDAADGTERWRFDAGRSVAASPAVADDTVYIKRNEGRRTGDADRVYALDAADGTEQWGVTLDNYDTSLSLSSPTVRDDTIYVADGRHVYALATNGGTRRWRFSPEGAVNSSLTLVDDTVYVTSTPQSGFEREGRLHALSVRDGTERWQFDADDPLGSATVADGTVYVGGEDSAAFYALDADDGARQWSHDIEYSASTPTVADGTVYFGTAVGPDTGTLYALSAAEGTVEWTLESTAGVASSPTVAGDTVCLGDNRSTLYSLDAADGTERWQADAAGGVSSPTIVDGTVYTGSDEGRVHAFALGTDRSSDGSRVELETLGYHDAG